MSSAPLQTKRFPRLLVGLAAVLFTLIVCFAFTIQRVHRYGATGAELTRPMPGDELITHPLVDWTHAITIHAAPAQVWPWIAQLGDRKAAFYSYTFIENMVAGGDVYHNANAILPQFQNPQPGDEIIGGALKIREVKTGEYLLADSLFPDLQWIWVWQLLPEGQDLTRLLIRMRIQIGAGQENPLVTFVMDAGGFVMERNMMLGIKERAEGRTEPAWIEPVEILLWLGTLAAGLVCAWAFLRRANWILPLMGGLFSILSLFILTFEQPALWLRALILLVLWSLALLSLKKAP